MATWVAWVANRPLVRRYLRRHLPWRLAIWLRHDDWAHAVMAKDRELRHWQRHECGMSRRAVRADFKRVSG